MSKWDEPQCSHADRQIMVTNQPGEYDSIRDHRACWVCENPECVHDAQAWVMRGTGDIPWWRTRADGEWHNDKYPHLEGTNQ